MCISVSRRRLSICCWKEYISLGEIFFVPEPHGSYKLWWNYLNYISTMFSADCNGNTWIMLDTNECRNIFINVKNISGFIWHLNRLLQHYQPYAVFVFHKSYQDHRAPYWLYSPKSFLSFCYCTKVINTFNWIFHGFSSNSNRCSP